MMIPVQSAALGLGSSEDVYLAGLAQPSLEFLGSSEIIVAARTRCVCKRTECWRPDNWRSSICVCVEIDCGPISRPRP
jgi:hypothetical protein